MSNALKSGSLLQEGRYKILSVLGHGGFGITYMAEQTGLDRKVAIKEFFMKDLCIRDEWSSRVTFGADGVREIVLRFRSKFLKEARNIARFNHPNIVRIIDVFEENGTAYYVMEYSPCGSLSDKVKREGPLPEPVATRYIKQIASALDYIHRQNVNHLDVKPGNVMLNERDESILIDFGLAKQYDVESGGQTSTTPVGISEGYAPMEQYKMGGVSSFTPETDVYALGATFFYLLTGQRPPSASDVMEDGVPESELVTRRVSQPVIAAISKAMEPRKRDRFRSMQEFVNAIAAGGENTVLDSEPEETVIAEVVEEPAPMHEYVDLGLPGGVLWATCNVGANKPEEAGLYFAWGETKGYAKDESQSFDWNNYSYNENRDLDASHDAATANWGDGWRMPTLQEIKDLIDSRYTTTEWVTVNGVKGRKITSKSNGNSIFLPAAGCRYGTSLLSEGSDGRYWSSSPNAYGSSSAYYLGFGSSGIGWNSYYRCHGRSVRAVRVASE